MMERGHGRVVNISLGDWPADRGYITGQVLVVDGGNLLDERRA